jgi:hypothetical protein
MSYIDPNDPANDGSTLAKNPLIQASDYNNFANALNDLWTVGTGDKGLGQTLIPTVRTGTKVTAAQWNAIIDVTNALAHKQGIYNSITQPDFLPINGNIVGSPDGQALIKFISTIQDNITLVTNNRLNALGQVSLPPSSVTSTRGWTSQAIYTFNATFASGDAARYFFNGGGQLQFTLSHVTNTPMDNMFAVLCNQIGTLVFSSPYVSPSSVHIANVNYEGFSQITTTEGGADPDSFQTQFGYYGLTTQRVLVFKQRMNSGLYSDYLGSSISVYAKTNGTQGQNGDNGSILTFEVVWSEIPPTLIVSAGSTVALTVKQPATTYMSNTWGGVNSPIVSHSQSYL